MTLSRQYVPPVGKSVKMRQFSDYTSRDINIWAWLRVHSVNSDGVTVQVLNGNEPTGQVVNVPLSTIAPPIGWAPRYTIHVSPDKVETVLSWFARGIVVRQSHDMSGSMPMAFQPMDNSAQPHWQFCEVTDAVPAEQCASIFRIVKVEHEEINHYSNPGHPNLREMGRSKRVKAIRAMEAEGWKVEYVPYAGGYWERTRETVVKDWE